MKRTRKSASKLNLSSETLRRLGDSELRRAAGGNTVVGGCTFTAPGGSGYRSCGCGPTDVGCPE